MLPLLGGRRTTPSNPPWSSTGPSATTLPILGFFGISPQPQPLPFINQENLPFPISATLWNHAWNLPPPPQPVQPQPQVQYSVGRPILGRRNDPNQQILDSQGQSNTGHGQSVSAAAATGAGACAGAGGGEDNDRGLKRSRPQSPVECWSQNNNHAGRKCFTPSSFSSIGVNTSIPPPPIVNLPRKDNEVYVHPTPQTNCNPVELHVTNLDQSIDLREMKKLLVSAFREHVMVLHVSVFVQSDGSLAASVKVPSMQDAQYAISQLHRRKVGFKRIMIAHAHSTSPQNPQYIKNQVVSLLLEVPGHKMPLFTFRELFASRYLSSVSVSDLYRMRDVCIIVEEKNGRTITLNSECRNTASPASTGEGGLDLPYCVLHSSQRGSADKGWAEQEQPSLANVSVPLAVLAERVTSLVHSHNNWLPLASLMDCYAAEFEPLTVDEQGAPLEHLVTCVSGVELVHSGNNKHLQPCAHKPALDNKSDETLVMFVSPSLANQVNLFARELVDLLKMQPHCQLLFNRFIPAYHHHFGRQCRVADYGFTKLIDLLEILPHVVQVMGEGNKRVVTLSHRAQMRRFTSDLLRVLKSQTSKQLMVRELPQLFERTLNRPFDPVDYGLCHLEDLLGQLSANIVLLSGEGKDLTIAMPKREQTPEEVARTKQFAVQVVELLSLTPQCSMEFAKFIPAYHHHYGAQCRVSDFGFTKLIELFEAIPEIVKIEEEGEGMRKVTLTLSEKIKVLSSQMKELVLTRYPPGLLLENVQTAYLWQFGYALKPNTYDCNNIIELLEQLSSVKTISSADGTTFVVPVDCNETHTLCLQVLRILWEHPSCKTSLTDFEQTFLHFYKQCCGRSTLAYELQGVVKVSEDFVELVPLQVFARSVYQLLVKSDGRLPLGSFDAAYHRKFGAPPLPAQLGYPSTLAMLQAIDHVVSICGRSSKRLLVLNSELAAVGILLPPGFSKTGNGFGKEFCNIPDSNRRATSQSLLKEIHLKANGDKIIQERGWDPLWNGKPTLKQLPNNDTGAKITEQYDQPTVVNMPEPRTPPSKEECMALLSPAKFLLPHAFSFLPASPDPSQLPKPDHFNLISVHNRKNVDLSCQSQDKDDPNSQAKRTESFDLHPISTSSASNGVL